MNSDWRVWRPVIWLAILGFALLLLISPPYVGGIVLGFAIGVAIRTYRGRRIAAAPPATRKRGGKRRR